MSNAAGLEPSGDSTSDIAYAAKMLCLSERTAAIDAALRVGGQSMEQTEAAATFTRLQKSRLRAYAARRKIVFEPSTDQGCVKGIMGQPFGQWPSMRELAYLATLCERLSSLNSQNPNSGQRRGHKA